MRTQRDLDAAIAQLKRNPADLTDDHLAVFRDRKGADFADRVEQSRERYRRGAEYQARLEAEQCTASYEQDCTRRRYLANQAQREASWRGMGESHRTPSPKRGVVRILTAEEIQRQQDRVRGVVRMWPPKGRR